MNAAHRWFPTASWFLAWLLRSRVRRRGLIALTILVLLAAIFYTEEDWRGKRAWESCKSELAARGVVLDWADYIPPMVPDAINVFKAPNMRRWFVGRGQNQFSRRLAIGTLDDFVKSRHPDRGPMAAAEVLVVPTNIKVPAGQADIVLRFDHGILTGPDGLPAPEPERSLSGNTVASASESPALSTDPALPSIVIEGALLTDVITNLARQGGFSFASDPQVEILRPGLAPSISVRWKDLSARSALLAILENYDLQLIDNPKTHISRITKKNRPAARPTASPPARASGVSTPSTGTVLPSLDMDGVRLTDAINVLSLQAGLNLIFDPQIGFLRPGSNGQPAPMPSVSLHWKNLTARGALLGLLDIYDLQLVEISKTRVSRITVKDRSSQRPALDLAVRAQLGRLLQKSLGPHASAAELPSLILRPTDQFTPLRVILQTDKLPSAQQVGEFFPDLSPEHSLGSGTNFLVDPDGSNSFRVKFGSPPCSAADYLAWSDQFGGDLAAIGEALKRPYARMPGDYESPEEMPIPNFVAVRTVAQMLSDRARCHLLLQQPDEALRELGLMRGLCRMLEARPTGKPMTLVAAMINVAITGLYVSVVGDGLRWEAWREPQLVQLQDQLGKINLLQVVEAGLTCEPAVVCNAYEATATFDLASLFNRPYSKDSSWQKFKSGSMLLLWAIVPRALVYQNMAVCATLQTKILGVFDLSRHLIRPVVAERAALQIISVFHHRSPYTLLAGVALPNYTRAVQVTGKNQTLADEALIACGLERYRLAHGEYPHNPDALVPQFLEKIPHDLIGGLPLNYRRAGTNGFLLYSIGWNETDDGGVESDDNENGDWVWASR